MALSKKYRAHKKLLFEHISHWFLNMSDSPKSQIAASIQMIFQLNSRALLSKGHVFLKAQKECVLTSSASLRFERGSHDISKQI